MIALEPGVSRAGRDRPGSAAVSPALAHGGRLAAFDGRCLPVSCVAPRSNTPGIPGRRALRAERLAHLDATRHVYHRLLALTLAIAAASCGARSMKLPSGAGVPVAAADAASAVAQATAECGAIRTLTAEIAVSGSAGGHRVRGRLSAGVAAPASARLEAVAPFGPPFFIFVATGDDATLLLPRDDRVLEHGRAGDVLDAVAGVPLDAADLAATLTGCASPAETAGAQARQIGDAWMILTAAAGAELYLNRRASSDPWQLTAIVRRGGVGPAWRTEYRDRQNGHPTTIGLASIGTHGGDAAARAAFDVQLVLSQVETNTALGADAFAIRIPPSAQPIGLDELRRSGPLAPKSDGR
jgi:hypothetical protein